MGKKENKNKDDNKETKPKTPKTKKKKKDDLPLVNINGTAGKENEGLDIDEEDKVDKIIEMVVRTNNSIFHSFIIIHISFYTLSALTTRSINAAY